MTIETLDSGPAAIHLTGEVDMLSLCSSQAQSAARDNGRSARGSIVRTRFERNPQFMRKQPYISSLIVVIRRTSRGSRCSSAAWYPTKSRSLPCNGRVLFHRVIYAVRGGYHRYSVQTWCTECAYPFRLLEAMEVTRRTQRVHRNCRSDARAYLSHAEGL